MPRREITPEEFDAHLIAVIEKLSHAQLLAIEGIYEVLAEALNNEVLADWEAKEKADDTYNVLLEGEEEE